MPPIEGLFPEEVRDTWIFVDVDGVLNVTVKDGNKPLIFDSTNVELAKKYFGLTAGKSGLVRAADTVVKKLEATYDRLVDAAEYAADSEPVAYKSFVANELTSVVDSFVARLAGIIRAAGDREHCRIILSSTWRAPAQKDKVEDLEKAISKHLEEEFTFDDRTDLKKEILAEERLKLIGDYIAKHAADRTDSLRVLVLDDFATSSMDQWSVMPLGGALVRSVEDAEEYLNERGGELVMCKLVYPIDRWRTEEGIPVTIGCGLTRRHVLDALRFLLGEDVVPLYDANLPTDCRKLDRALSQATTEDPLSPLCTMSSAPDFDMDDAPMSPAMSEGGRSIGPARRLSGCACDAGLVSAA
eukprot:TRINITY_DN5908_c0_g1_i20.p1 TRINITY_DN5908_c0_g1~~TRINITY_DN5908_c0_g1_i20.p1  ORF type:complete len:356 (-),score=72.81 TRINITY_DN5908_c0_g1_i20:295-1362(-)